MFDARGEIRLLLALALVAQSAAAAQTTAVVRARFVAISDSAVAVRRVIDAQSAREAQRGPAPDTLRYEGLTLVTIGMMPAELRPALPLAWQALVQRYGVETAQARTLVEVVAQSGSTATLAFSGPGIQGSRSPASIGRVSTATRESLAEAIAAIAGRNFWAGADSALKGWRESADPVWSARSVNLEDLYVQLVTTPWTVPKRCYQGNLDSCRDILALDPTRHVLIASYTADEWPSIVSRDVGYASNRVIAESVGGCVNGRDSTLCARVLTQGFPEPWSHRGALKPPGRQALLAVALETGGAGAFRRLLASPQDPLGVRLARAAGVSQDSLLAHWRNEILAARPRVVSVTPAGGWVAMGWITLLGMLALRSSRWR